MSNQIRPPNKEVSPDRRESILGALEADRFNWYADGGRFLERFDIDPEAFVFNEVIPYLQDGFRLYELPQAPEVKSQCCIEWDDQLIIHVKLTERPDDSELAIMFGFHPHNTGYKPLPK